MADVTSMQTTPQTDAEYEAAIEQMLSEMKHLRTMMDSDQAEIDRLKVETQALKAETRAMLTTLKGMVQSC